MTIAEQGLRLQARLAGALYLLIIVLAGFAEGYVRSSLVVPGQAASTASNILASPVLFRLGVAADLTAFLADAAVAVLLYGLLRATSPTIALLALVFRLVAHPAIAAINLLNPVAALLVLEGPGPLSGLPLSEREGLAQLAMDLHGYGYLIAGAFFGIHCVLLGYLLWRSPRFPQFLGILMGLAAAGYLLETGSVLLASSLATLARQMVVITAVAGEGGLCLYLLICGVRSAESLADAPTES
ncbi:DUF4386 domain-containing protein [Synechococcus sp. CBW1107]|uniref:DUF4386 domain-containing protein n=1 Tax=Synechococcus sp. CBW1107 TaxID=2789857 RepID=UPI002AD55232|nr:DUF4386 domain-containing protein [Synechococcus sp. CBW1107]CAK6690040.1 hypothetical protein ICNINCKA_00728 [Synechococcus sp. CBW1107]